MSKIINLAILGDRPKKLFGYDRSAYKTMIERINEFIVKLAEANNAVIDVSVDGQQGAGQIGFWAAVKAKSKNAVDELTLYIPFTNFADKWPVEGAFGQNDYHRMLHTADAYTVLSMPKGGLTISDAAELISKTDRMMVDYADVVLAVVGTDFDINGRSFLEETIRYAEDNGRQVLFMLSADKSGKCPIISKDSFDYMKPPKPKKPEPTYAGHWLLDDEDYL